MPPAVQSSYPSTMAIGHKGQVADLGHAERVSRTVEDATLAFGVAVIQGTDDTEVVVGAAGVFVGITERDITLPEDYNDLYQQGHECSVVRKGVIFVTPTADVDAGDPVYRTAAGALTNVSTSNTLIAGAVWESSATSGNLAKLRLG